MCGIAGEVRRRERSDVTRVETQLQTLLHRGPDSCGVYAGGAGTIGQTRLAVIDLSTGDPPITAAHGRVGAVLNGEIYNFGELREQLRTGGHRFSTSGDTEVIAHLGEEHDGPAIARRLHGMFAFGVWDDRRQRLVLGRDRLGKKPLYWWCEGSTFVFGSEIKAVLAHPAVAADLDDAAIPAYLTFGYVPSPRTFFRGIRSLPPGHVLTIDADDLEPRIEPYWQPLIGPHLDVDAAEAAWLVRAALEDAVDARLVADVRLGAFLSGGVDSSAVVGLMARRGPVRTFTIGFEGDERFDERRWATIAARRFGTDHTEFVVQPNAVDLVERLVWHHDQPFGDSSAIPTYVLSELTKGEVTVALSGDGGDELFAGYERFLAGLVVARAGSLARLVPRRAADLGPLPPKVRRLLRTASAGMPDAYRQWVGFVDDETVGQLVPGADRWGLDDYRARWQQTSGAHPLDRLLLLNLETYLLDDLLPKVDRTSMAVALEVRSPFLDHQLVELAFRLPPRTKLRRGRLKQVLKDAVADFVPREVLDRPKRGFGVPLNRWFREDLAEYVNGTLARPDAAVRRHLREEAVDGLLAQHATGRRDRGHELWTLLTLEVFLKQHGW